ncbi:hypothetical protein Ddye_016738 [Dipteronia dyeriana]|uniref:Uncharacterized protein n=1 Tax=Dipteronia dyeriana TaxID=168575 RepID=A0AAD9U886_9ROSI|nr:hypothetical protein Ddye_016738 [Dipteronia dyeriana]
MWNLAFFSILLTVYRVTPNYISFGYIFLLLAWIIERQLVEKIKRRLWYPLKAYAITVFVIIYSLSSFSSFQMWSSRIIDLYFYLGYNSDASLLENVWESLAVLIVMQPYSYERRQSRYNRPDDTKLLDSGLPGFMKRLLVMHSQKTYLLYYSIPLSPISAFGFLYLIGLVICSTFLKAS